MAREKATITLDRAKAEALKSLLDAGSVSEAIDVALSRAIRMERLRHDVEAYSAVPLTDEELALADLPVHLDLDDDDVDYEEMYGRD